MYSKNKKHAENSDKTKYFNKRKSSRTKITSTQKSRISRKIRKNTNQITRSDNSADVGCEKEGYCRHDQNAHCKRADYEHEFCECNDGYKGTGHPNDPACEC